MQIKYNIIIFHLLPKAQFKIHREIHEVIIHLPYSARRCDAAK